jgi:hypothetical protein
MRDQLAILAAEMAAVGGPNNVAKNGRFLVPEMRRRRKLDLTDRDHAQGIGRNSRHRFLPRLGDDASG